MPKPTNAKAPALPDAQKVKQTKGLLMRKKSDAIVSAETARKLTEDLRAGWGKSVKSKGKGKGKGKKGKGKGKGEKTWKKVASEEDRMAAVEKLDKKVEKKRRDSLVEMDKIDAMLKPKKAKFKKVKTIQPDSKGLNLMLKCVKCDKVEGTDAPTWEAVCGDETGVVTFSLRSEGHADLCKAGASLRVQNAKVIMAKGYVRVVVDKWGVLKAADKDHDFEPEASKDMSGTEYELA